jgi:hypothetical protein
MNELLVNLRKQVFGGGSISTAKSEEDEAFDDPVLSEDGSDEDDEDDEDEEE